MDECKRLLLHNSGASALVGDALAIAGEMLERHGMAVPSTHVLWNHEHLDRAINEYFCSASDHDIDIERVQQAITRSLPNVLRAAIENDEVLKELGRTVLTTIQSHLESARQTIGRSIVETFRCTKDTSRFQPAVFNIFP
jgi:hypothetical protein